MNTRILDIQNELRALGDERIAKQSHRFFKTGKGQYGEGDQFLGIRVPVLRRLARKYRGTPIDELLGLLRSEFHEERLLSLLMFVDLFQRVSETRKTIYTLYLDHTRYVNNWDLVDSSAEHIVGAYLRERDRKPIYNLSHSEILWERRVAIMSTFHFIKQDEFIDVLRISAALLEDAEDLIHKAVGWMLREIGKRDIGVEEDFLRKHYRKMPRTMLRYAIEKFPEERRQDYLKGEV